MANIRVEAFSEFRDKNGSIGSCEANFDSWVCIEGSTLEELFKEDEVGFTPATPSFILDTQHQILRQLCETTGSGGTRVTLFLEQGEFRNLVDGLSEQDEIQTLVTYADEIAPRSDDNFFFVSGLLEALVQQDQSSLAGFILTQIKQPEAGAWLLQGMAHPVTAARLLNSWLSWNPISEKKILGINEDHSHFPASNTWGYRRYFDEIRACSEKGFRNTNPGYRETILSWLDAYERSQRSPSARSFITQFSPLRGFYRIDFSKERGDILQIRCHFDQERSKQSTPKDPQDIYEMIADGTSEAEHPHKELFEVYRRKLAVRLAAQTEPLPEIRDWGDYEPLSDTLADAGMDILKDQALYNRLADDWDKINGPDPDNEEDAGLVRIHLQDMEAEVYLQRDAVNTTIWKTIDGIKYGIWENHLDGGDKVITQIEASIGKQDEGRQNIAWRLHIEDFPNESSLIFSSEGDESQEIPLKKEPPQEDMQTFFRNLFQQAFGPR